MSKLLKINTGLYGIGTFNFVAIKDEGIDKSNTNEPRMMYVASMIVSADSPVLKAVKKAVEELWEESKPTIGGKGLLTYGYGNKCVGIKPERIQDPSGEIDPETEEIKWVETGNWQISATTTTTWRDGKPKVVNLFNSDGVDETKKYASVDYSIGSGSRGALSITAGANDTGGKAKISLYLNSVQLTHLEKYRGEESMGAIEGAEKVVLDDESGVSAIVDDGGASEVEI